MHFAIQSRKRSELNTLGNLEIRFSKFSIPVQTVACESRQLANNKLYILSILFYEIYTLAHTWWDPKNISSIASLSSAHRAGVPRRRGLRDPRSDRTAVFP